MADRPLIELKIHIPKFEVRKDRGTYVLFDVVVYKPGAGGSLGTKWVMKRRMEEFKWLASKISERKIKGLPKFPGKKTTKRKALENQRIELKNWLATIAGEIDVMSITPIRTWFELNDQGRHTPPAKKSGINARAIAVVKGVCDYTPRDDYELPFNTNDMISVIEKLDDTWWSGKLNGLVGCFPVAFTELVADMEAPRKATEEELMGRSRGQQRGGPGGGGQFGGGGGGGGGEPGRALYDFTPSGSNQVAIRAGESIQIVNDSNAQWFEITNAAGQTGFAPATYVEKVAAPPPPPPASVGGFGGGPAAASPYGGGGAGGYNNPAPTSYAPPAAATATQSYYEPQPAAVAPPASVGGGGGKRMCRVLYDYAAANEDEINLVAGTSVEVYSELEDGWYYGCDANGNQGVFPATYCEG